MKYILEFEKWVNVNEKKSKFDATIKTDSDKRPRIFFFFKKKIIRKPSLKHVVL